jgi:5'-deoxynucleotidase YfbR-like HD superfamily hydrolase
MSSTPNISSNKQIRKHPMQSLVHLMNEIGMLAHIPRSGYAFLGAGKQSVAEHSHRMALVAYILARKSTEPVDMAKLLLMCLLHDLPEARTGDLNYVNKRYVEANEDKVIEELKGINAVGKEMGEIIPTLTLWLQAKYNQCFTINNSGTTFSLKDCTSICRNS